MNDKTVLASQEPRKYQVKSGYMLREVAGEYLAIPIALKEESDTKVAILSFGGKYLWEQLTTEKTIQELVQAMTDYFDIDIAQAEADILEFIQYLEQYGLLENEQGGRI